MAAYPGDGIPYRQSAKKTTTSSTALSPFYIDRDDQSGQHSARHDTTAGYDDATTDDQQNQATPAMNIPMQKEKANVVSPESQEDSYMDRYMRQRNPSISFNTHVRIESGHRQSMDEPLEKPSRSRPRGRSMMQALAEAQQAHRSHSESTRDDFDPVTGRHLPKYSSSPPRDAPHVGEARFPLLQQTVDDMARESRKDLSVTTESLMPSIAGRIATASDAGGDYPASPIAITPASNSISGSFESPRPFRRTASERWRNGESAQDFSSSTRGSRRTTGSWRNLRRDTANSAKSPSSVASSFLRAFSMGSGGDESNASTAIDAEGQTVGEDYVLGKQIGFGGFSIVREVTQLSSETGRQRKLAVKIVRRNIDGKSDGENEAAQAEFEHEVELWRFLSHPHVLPLEAVYKLDEATFCFIPLNTGGTLFDLMRKHRTGLPLDLARTYTYQIASALRYLHLDARVVHRDVKLENCLLDTTCGEPGVVRLCDFGMAEWLTNDNNDPESPPRRAYTIAGPSTSDRPPTKCIGPADSSSAAFAGGSLEYAAPEIVQRAHARENESSYSASGSNGSDNNGNQNKAAERSLVSPAVDIWALGVCLFIFLIGRRPFTDSFLPRVVMSILRGEWDREAVAVKLGNQADADSIMKLLDGCLKMDEHERWRIDDVAESAWFDVERERDDEMDATGGGGGGGGAGGDASKGWRL